MFSSRVRKFTPALSAALNGAKPMLFKASSLVSKPVMAQIARSVVTVADAQKMIRNYNEMPNDVLLTLAINGDDEARQERLIREIMAVDNCSWEKAHPQFLNIVKANRSGLFMATLPYKLGIFSAVAAGFVSLPMIFEINTVLWFNELYVTTDVPDAKDLETPLEVGSFAWNWMEPPLGTISFFLLCMQYARAQMENLGVKPYTAWYKHARANRVCRQFPQYNAGIVKSFSEGDSLTPTSVFHSV